MCHVSKCIITIIMYSIWIIPANAALKRYEVIDSLRIGTVWSGHPVDFAFISKGDTQYISYYDNERNMTVAKRDITSDSIQKVKLPSVLGWDSHNYIAIALDNTNNLHVSGNMHSTPLVYFRSSKPGDITSIVKTGMVGSLETAATYPLFFNGPNNTLVFNYRDGTSGNGNQIFNRYEATEKKWTRLLDKPLFDGEGARNAYMGGPFLGPDGYYHLYYSWRETPDASTTHDIGYIKTRDLINWETAAGTKLTLPVKLSTPGVLIEQIPEKSGIINRGAIGFDSKNRVIVTYHKFDAKGFTQLYNARWEGAAWKIYQTSDWDYRWNFGGGGTLILEVTFGPIIKQANGSLTQAFYHVKKGTGLWEINESTMKPIAELGTSLWPLALEKLERSGMVIHWQKCTDVSKDPSILYALRWETMPENQDKPLTTIPAPTNLILYTFKDPNVLTSVTSNSFGCIKNCQNDIDKSSSSLKASNVRQSIYDISGRKLNITLIADKMAQGKYILENNKNGVRYNQGYVMTK